MTKLGRFKDSEVIRDVDAAVDMLAAHEMVAGQPIGITGFCMGGRGAYLMAAKSSKIAASGIFYGAKLTASWGDEGPSPMDLTADVGCLVIGFFGKDDQNPTPEIVAQLDALLTTSRPPIHRRAPRQRSHGTTLTRRPTSHASPRV